MCGCDLDFGEILEELLFLCFFRNVKEVVGIWFDLAGVVVVVVVVVVVLVEGGFERMD